MVRALVSLPAIGARFAFSSVMSVPRKKGGSPRASPARSRGRPKSRRHQATSAAERTHAQQVRVRTPGDIVNEQTIEALALRIWAAMVGAKVLTGMSALMDELL